MFYIAEWHGDVYGGPQFSEEQHQLWERIREIVIERDMLRCQACRKIFASKKRLTVHHIIPRGEGGTNDFDNLITLCGKCHDFIEETEVRTRREILYLTYGVDWDKLQQEESEDHNRFMNTLDTERPEWHEVVYGCRRRKRRKSGA